MRKIFLKPTKSSSRFKIEKCFICFLLISFPSCGFLNAKEKLRVLPWGCTLVRISLRCLAFKDFEIISFTSEQQV